MNLIRVTINGNPYRVPEGKPVHKTDIRRRLAGKIGFGKLRGLDKVNVEYRKFLEGDRDWKPVTKGLIFGSGMAFRCLVRARGKGCRLVKSPAGGMAFVCTR